MFKSRSITLFVSSILTSLGFLIMLLVTLFTSAEDYMTGTGYAPGTADYDSAVLGFKFIVILTTIALFVALVLYWVSFATKMSGFVLAGAIILTASIPLTLLVNFILVIIPLVLGYVSFGLQRSVNKRERMAMENEMPVNDSSSSIDPTMMQF